MTIEITDEEFNQLIIMAGYAMGAAHRSGEQSLARSFLRVANAINRDNPRWTRYQIEDEPET